MSLYPGESLPLLSNYGPSFKATSGMSWPTHMNISFCVWIVKHSAPYKQKNTHSASFFCKYYCTCQVTSNITWQIAFSKYATAGSLCCWSKEAVGWRSFRRITKITKKTKEETIVTDNSFFGSRSSNSCQQWRGKDELQSLIFPPWSYKTELPIVRQSDGKTDKVVSFWYSCFSNFFFFYSQIYIQVTLW